MNIIIKLKNHSTFRIQNCNYNDFESLRQMMEQNKMIHVRNFIIHSSEVLWICEEQIYLDSEE